MFQEVLEQQSDDGLDEIVADQHVALSFYEAALQAIPFLEEEEEEEVEAFDDAFIARMRQMELGKDGSDDDQGGASDAESYGKVEETAPYRAQWFSVFGLGLWLKLGFPSICLDYSLMGFYLWGCSRGR